MARTGLLVLMVGALAVCGTGTTVTRTTTVTLSIPPISVLSLPERNISGREVVVELCPKDFLEGVLLIPLEVKSNVPWAVTAQLLSEEGAELALEVVGGPEVALGTEEVSLLLGRSGRHELLLRLKIRPQTRLCGAKLVLKVNQTGLR